MEMHNLRSWNNCNQISILLFAKLVPFYVTVILLLYYSATMQLMFLLQYIRFQRYLHVVLSVLRCNLCFYCKFIRFQRYLHVVLSVSRMDRVRNEEVRRRAGIERELASRADQRVLRWFGHVERMDENRIARRVLMAKVLIMVLCRHHFWRDVMVVTILL